MRYTDIKEGEKPKKGYSAYVLDDASRSSLLGLYQPKYSKIVAHHVTYAFGTSSLDDLPPAGSYEVVGYADSEDGLEALVVEVNGTTEREDGSIYHITWSLDPDKYKPVDSNKLLKKGWNKVDPVLVNMKPTFVPFNS